METVSALGVSATVSLVSFNFIGVALKVPLILFGVSNDWICLALHVLISNFFNTATEYASLCLVIISINQHSDIKTKYNKAFLQFILILFASGLVSSHLEPLFPSILCLILSMFTSQKISKIKEQENYKLRIKEENKIYSEKIEQMRKQSKDADSPIRRSSSLLNKLKTMRASNMGKSFTEGSDIESSNSENYPEFSSRKSSINIEDSSSGTPKKSSFIIPENLLPGISNEEIKEIIHALISQEYLMWNPSKCGEKEIDVIALALESKKVYTQSIQNLPGSSHRAIKLPKFKKLRSIRTMIEVSDSLTEVLESIGEWDFDCFELIKVTKDPAFEVGLYIFNTLGLNDKFEIPDLTLKKFLTSVEHGYIRNNYYHNSIHAADVTASTLFLVQKGLLRCGNLMELDVFALVTAALCHDIGHLGVNNAFLVATGHDLAVKYNDQSCLENMHTNKTFTILNTEGSQITAFLSKADYQRFRKGVVEAILSTDLQMHFGKLAEFQANLDKKLDISDDKFRVLAIQMCLKCADIGHGARKLNIHIQWTALISKEFFKQGEMEKEFGIPISPLCDIENCIISKSQVGFLEVLVKPLFIVWEEFIEQNNVEDSDLEVKVCLLNIQENIEFWSQEYLMYQKGDPQFSLDSNPPPLVN